MSDTPAVIFDMDGVLVDTFRAHYESWRRVGADEGRRITRQEFAATFGRTSREVIASWQGGGRYTEAEIAALDYRKEAIFRELLARDFPVMPGAVALLRSLRQAGFALGVGSSGPPPNVELVLDRLDARELFGAVITGGDVTRGKPDPQVFLLAAERLGVRPDRCAVVEDAALGIEAARAAGMAAVGFVSTGRTREELAGADLVVGRMGELSPEIFRELIGRRPAKSPK
jgi:beta-phosphoglucomutase